jgi:hypothetical protein
MKRGQKMWIGMAAGLVLSAGAGRAVAASPANPYAGIVERNVFALKPPPTPKPPDPPPKPPLPKIELTGITSIFGQKQAMGRVLVPPNLVNSFFLSEGQREGDVEVLEIDEKAGAVHFNNRGEPQWVSLPTNNVAGTAGAPQRGAPPPVTVNPAASPVPAMPAISGAPRTIPIPQRPIRPPTAPGEPADLSAAPAMTPPMMSVPAMAPPPAPVTTMTPEEQIIMMEVERERTKEQVQRGELPPLPPTVLTPQ